MRSLLLINVSKKIKSFAFCAFLFAFNFLSASDPIWFQEGVLIEDIQTALKTSPNKINVYNSDGITGLMLAAKEANPQMARAFLDAGANLNLKSKDEWGQTALHIAVAQSGDPEGVEVVKMLLEKGATPWLLDTYHNQPIHSLRFNVQAIDARAKVLSFLVKKGANINAQNKDGDTLLHLTVQDMPWIKKLRKDFWPLINLSIKNKKGYTASKRAYMLGRWDVSKLIDKPISKVDPDKRYPNGLTGLMLAVISGNKKMVEKMLQPDTQVNLTSQDDFKNTALHFSVLQRLPEIAKMLLADRAKDSIINTQGDAPIHLIFRSTNKEKRNELAQVFFEDADVDVNIKNKDGNTFLHLAVLGNDKDLIQYLITNFPKRLDLSIKNNKFQTPLDLAKKNKEIMNMFEKLRQVKQFVTTTALLPNKNLHYKEYVYLFSFSDQIV